MKIEYFKEYSEILGRDMEFKVFGHGGKPCIAFPTQNGRFYDYEDRGIIESMSWYIEQGRIQVFCVDSMDVESFSAEYKDPKERIENQERYFNYIINELVNRVYEINNFNHEDSGILTFGVSLGAYHAVNCFLRRPDIFDGVLALSGVYRAEFWIKDYSSDLMFLNSPITSLSYMKHNHPYIELYKKSIHKTMTI